LDYIRQTNVTAKEAGGITQSIGAYEIVHSGKKITFIDTPGHEAFSKMRARGTQAADLAILVVAADEGVKPQTKEAFDQIQAAKIPFIVALNKIDKPNINLDKVKNELMTASVLLEGYGGSVSWQAISAKTGQGVQELLDLILLAADLENLRFNPQVQAKGIIVEALLDNRRGIVVSVIVEDGTLKLGDYIATTTAGGKIKSLENFLGERTDSLEPSAPALILGFESLPQIGEEFQTGETALASTEKILPAGQKTSAVSTEETTEKINPVRDESLNGVKVILKAENAGALEALSDVIKNIPSNKSVEVLDQGVGRINENDFKLASDTKAIIIGFRVKLDKSAENLQKISPIDMIVSDVIYELVEKFKDYLDSTGKINITAELEILAVFGTSGKNLPAGRHGKQIVGGKITEGLVKNQQKFEVWRNEQVFTKGRVLNLQEQKTDVAEAGVGKEVGLLVAADDIIKIGDKLKFYELSKPAGS
jgi:translation initiation factor IF-2